MKWKLYWATLVAILLGVLWFKNRHYYPTQSKKWNASKSLIECGLLVLAAAFLPAILTVYGGMWITKHIQRPGLRVGIGFITSIVMMLMLTNFLEFVVLIGVFAVELITGEDGFLGYLEERRERQFLKTVAYA